MHKSMQHCPHLLADTPVRGLNVRPTLVKAAFVSTDSWTRKVPEREFHQTLYLERVKRCSRIDDLCHYAGMTIKIQ